jgi:hypothetical protein
LIKEGGVLDLYYVASSDLEENVKEGYRTEDKVEDGEGNLAKYYTGAQKKELIPSIIEIIDLNKDIKLEVNIYVFTFETFFRDYLTSDNVFSPSKYLNRTNNKL